MTTRIDGGMGAVPQFTGNPELDAQNYARQNGISLEEAKAELRAKFGDPQVPPQPGMTETGTLDFNYKPQGSANTSQVPPEQMALIQKGIPPEVILQGDDAIRKYAEDNNISLPAKKQVSERVASTETSEVAEFSSGELMTSKDKKAWIKNYRETHNCSKREAYDAFYAKFEKANMSRKEAKAWMKAYSEENGVSKKEAKAAFEKEHGYPAPSSKTSSFFKCLLLMCMTPVTVPIGLADHASGGKLGFIDEFQNFMGNNDVRYKEKA